MTDIKKIKTHIPRPELSGRKRKSAFKIVARELIYPPIYWFMAHLYNVPGLHIQAMIYLLGLKLLAQGKFRLVYSQKLLSSPMDSVRYFEFDFFYKRFLHDSDVENYLDVSSPRLFPTLVMRHHLHMKATVINPDIKDLNITKELFSACGFQNRCKFFNDTIANLSLPDRSFDPTGSDDPQLRLYPAQVEGPADSLGGHRGRGVRHGQRGPGLDHRLGGDEWGGAAAAATGLLRGYPHGVGPAPPDAAGRHALGRGR